MSTSASGNAAPVIGMSEWSIDRSSDKPEVTEFGAANKSYVRGLSDVSISFSGFWDNTDDSLYSASESADGVKMYLYPDRLNDEKFWSGPAWVDMSMSVSATGAISVSGTAMANGDWSFETGT